MIALFNATRHIWLPILLAVSVWLLAGQVRTFYRRHKNRYLQPWDEARAREMAI